VISASLRCLFLFLSDFLRVLRVLCGESLFLKIRKEQPVGELVREIWVRRKLNVFQPGRNLLGDLSLLHRYQHLPGACPSRVAHLPEAALRKRREHAHLDGAVDADVRPERPGDDKILDILGLDAGLCQQGLDAGADSALGKLDLIDIPAGDEHVLAVPRFASRHEDELMQPITPAHQRVAADQSAAPVQDARLKHGGYCIQDARTADAHCGLVADGLEADFSTLSTVYNLDPFDRPWSGAHSIPDMGTLESRTGSARAAKQATVMVEGYLGVGADIQSQGGALGVPGAGCQIHGDMIGADREHVSGAEFALEIAAFVSGGLGGRGGAELTLISLLACLAEHGMLLVPMHNRLDGFREGGCHWGPIAWTNPQGGEAGPTAEHLRAARSHGRHVAECTARWLAGAAAAQNR